MKRPVGVTVLAVLAFIGAPLVLVVGLPYLGVRAVPTFAGPPPLLAPFIPPPLFGVIMLLLAITYVAFGIGALLLKRWAWYLAVVGLSFGLVNLILQMLGAFNGALVLAALIYIRILFYLFKPEIRGAFGEARPPAVMTLPGATQPESGVAVPAEEPKPAAMPPAAQPVAYSPPGGVPAPAKQVSPLVIVLAIAIPVLLVGCGILGAAAIAFGPELMAQFGSSGDTGSSEGGGAAPTPEEPEVDKLEGIVIFESALGEEDTELYIMNADGSGRTQLTDNSVDDVAASLSPDGRKVAFSRIAADGTADIFIADLVDSGGFALEGEVQLTRTEESEYGGVWSPDGRTLLTMLRTITDVGDVWDIAAVSVESGEVRPLTSSEDWDLTPSWSPNGELILYTSGPLPDFDLYTMKADGSDIRPLTSEHLGDVDAAWSPDGSQIAFVRGSGETTFIYLMDSTGSGAPTELVSGWSPCWSLDGKRIMFVREGDLWVITLEDAREQQITDTPGEEDGAPYWRGR